MNPQNPHEAPVNPGENGRGGEIRTHDLLHPKHVIGFLHSTTSDTNLHFMPCLQWFCAWVVFIVNTLNPYPTLSGQ